MSFRDAMIETAGRRMFPTSRGGSGVTRLATAALDGILDELLTHDGDLAVHAWPLFPSSGGAAAIRLLVAALREEEESSGFTTFAGGQTDDETGGER